MHICTYVHLCTIRTCCNVCLLILCCSWPYHTMTNTCSLLERTGLSSCSRLRTRRAGGSRGIRRLCSQRRFSSQSQILRRRYVCTYACTFGFLIWGTERGGGLLQIVFCCLAYCLHTHTHTHTHSQHIHRDNSNSDSLSCTYVCM